MRITFVRHCEILHHNNFVHNSPLNDLGLQQARAISKELAQFNYKAIYTSHLIRAIETACYLARELKIEVFPYWGFNEYGWGGTSHYGDDQDIKSIRRRCVGEIERFSSEWRKENDNYIIVSHGGPIMMMVAYLLHKPESEVSCERGQYIHVEL